MPQETRKGANYDTPDPGPFLAKIVSHVDPAYMGSLEVQLIHESGNDEDREGQLRIVKRLNPFYGTTSMEFVGDSPDTHDETQKSYGMWFIPPDVGTIVACIFIGGDPRKGYWFGCVQDEDANFMVPGFAATKYVVDDSRQTDREKERVPVSEYNKIIHSEVQSDNTKKLKPEHPIAKALEDQGLLKDDTRGITTSSGRREVPSMVFGISTPGPTDKAGKTAKIGKWEHKVAGAFVSRLGGSSFVMDDGDDKWERKTEPTEGPPEYVSVEAGETALRDRPHNELIRLRTRTGHQILLHNSEDLIYIGNSRGTAWIELTSDGKIDIFSADSISVRTKQDFNFRCDRDFNLDVGRNFNIKVGGEMHTRVCKDSVLIVDANQKIEIKNRKDETVTEEYRQTVGGHVKKVYKDDYTHNVLGRMDLRVTNGVSASLGTGSDPEFAPYEGRSDDPDNPCANDGDRSVPIKDVAGPTPDRVDIKVFKDMRIEHIGVNVDHTIDGYLKTKIKGSVDINTDSTWKHTTAQNIEIKSGATSKVTSAQNFEVSSGSSNKLSSSDNNFTAGSNKFSGVVYSDTRFEAPDFDTGGQGGSTASQSSTAAVAALPEEGRISAKATLQHYLAENVLPDLSAPDAWQNLESLVILPRRAPTFEPYPHHENLGPTQSKPDPLMRDTEARYDPPDQKPDPYLGPWPGWRKYSTTTDTFGKGD